LEIQPNDTDLLFNLGNLYNTTNQFGLAKDTYLKALDKKPDFAEAHYNLGLLYSKTNEPKSAVTHLERYLELSPDSPNKDAVKNFLKKLKA
jgi:tetratricopeptide (TPR) repeat protein